MVTADDNCGEQEDAADTMLTRSEPVREVPLTVSVNEVDKTAATGVNEVDVGMFRRPGVWTKVDRPGNNTHTKYDCETEEVRDTRSLPPARVTLITLTPPLPPEVQLGEVPILGTNIKVSLPTRAEPATVRI